MHRDSDRHKLFSRRAAILGGGKMVLLSALVGRMYYLQVVESERYATLAEENRINLRLLPPLRGRIVDRFGVPMATNQQNYRVVLNSEDILDAEATLDVLGAIINIGSGERRRILREIRRRRSFVPVTLRENLVWDEVARIEVNTPDLPGVTIDVGQSRYYPNSSDTAHILGYVAAVSEEELGGDPLLELPGFRIGKSGIEKVHDLALRGAGGSSQVEVNALGRVIRELSRQEGQPGAEVNLTIDLGLQKMVSRRLKGERAAAAVVIDTHNGGILAMDSTPSFDPNAFNTGMSLEQWNELVSDTDAPLSNKAISGHYPPGSSFKMIVALAALERGTITPKREVFCKGYTELGEDKFYCWKRGGHGVVDLNRAIAESCDVYFYDAGLRTGIDRIAAMARRFGLGRPLGMDLPGELPGLVPDTKWKKNTYGKSWRQADTLLTGIGQGYLLATPLQLAVMTAQLTNGGYELTPHLTRNVKFSGKTIADERNKPRSIGLSAAHLALIRGAMETVVNDPTGTAFKSRITRPGFEMGGKTGTVQVRRISEQEREQGVRKNKDLPWKNRDHAVFVGYAPLKSPRYAVSVVVEHGGGGASVAAPIGRDILLAAQLRNSAGQGSEQPTSEALSAPKASGKG